MITLSVVFISTIFLGIFVTAAPANVTRAQTITEIPADEFEATYNTPAVLPVGPPNPFVCGITSPIQCMKLLVNNIAVGLLTIGSLILGISGVLLNNVMAYTIVNMSAHVGANGDLYNIINKTWTTFRDLANMAFIFILLYVAIGTILGLGNVDMKKMLTRVIIVALLLNFSLFFTKLIIDGSNTLTVVFYNQINASVSGEGANIANAYMQKFGFTSWYNTGTAGNVIATATGGDWIKMLEVGFLGMIFMGTAAFIFFAMSILFISRFVIIIFLFILSPLAFAAMALPNDKYSGRWFSALWDQVIFAPVCIALLWIVLQLLDVIVATPDPNQNIASMVASLGNGATGAGASAGAIFMNFFIIIAFTVAALIIAKEAGAHGAGGLMKFGKKLRVGAQGYFGGATAGALGYAGRRTVGWTGRNIADSEALKKAEASGGWRGALAGVVRGKSKDIAKSSFDVRATKIGGELAGTIGGLGKAGGKDGYDKFVEEREKLALDRAKDLGPSKVKVDQAQQAVERTKERERAIRESYKTPLELIAAQEKTLKDSLAPSEKKLEDMKKEQLADMERLKDARIPDTAKAQIQKNISDRAAGINTLSNKLQIDSIPLGKIRDQRIKIEGKIGEELKVVIEDRKSAQGKVDELKGISEDEAKKRFGNSGAKSVSQREAEARFAGDKEKIKEFMKNEEERYVRENKTESPSKLRAFEYASKAVERPWRSAFRLYKNPKTLGENRPMFSNTRYNEAQKIRSEFSKGKEDQQWEKLFEAVKKGKTDGVEKPAKKPDDEGDKE